MHGVDRIFNKGNRVHRISETLIWIDLREEPFTDGDFNVDDHDG